MLTKLDPATLIAETAMGLKVGDPASGHGVSVKEPSSDEVAAAMAAAEDEGDAAAATALAKETAAEMDEFTKVCTDLTGGTRRRPILRMMGIVSAHDQPEGCSVLDHHTCMRAGSPSRSGCWGEGGG